MGVDHSHRCIGCMGEKGRGNACPLCGYRESDADFSPDYLQPRTVLDGRYLVGRVLGQGGFGITYLAWDLNLEVQLALKEYMPGKNARRDTGGSSIKLYSGLTQEDFDYGLDKLSEEARTLAKFHEHPGIVTVHNFFRANGTGYMVMQYVDGVTFKQYLESQGGKIGCDMAVKILMPVMDALRELHGVNLLHRDISPDNIYITIGKQVKLLDFGAARYATGERNRELTIMMKPGYAPEEQYRTKGKQGPWTDVYALCATLYRAITGVTPPEAMDRMDEDDLVQPSKMGIALPITVETALMKGLSIRGAGRWQTVQELQDALIEIGNEKTVRAEQGRKKSAGYQPEFLEIDSVSTVAKNRASRMPSDEDKDDADWESFGWKKYLELRPNGKHRVEAEQNRRNFENIIRNKTNIWLKEIKIKDLLVSWLGGWADVAQTSMTLGISPIASIILLMLSIISMDAGGSPFIWLACFSSVFLLMTYYFYKQRETVFMSVCYSILFMTIILSIVGGLRIFVPPLFL